MKFTKPEGCVASVTENWETLAGRLLTRDQYFFIAKMVCGDRSNECQGSFDREFGGLNNPINAERTESRVGDQVTQTLAAMCLGCPHNSLETS